MANFPQTNRSGVPVSLPASNPSSGSLLPKVVTAFGGALVAIATIINATYPEQSRLCFEHPGCATCFHLADLGPTASAGPDMLGPDHAPLLAVAPIYLDTQTEIWSDEPPADDDNAQVQALQVKPLRPELEASATQLNGLIKEATLRSGVSEFLKGCGRRRPTANAAADAPDAEEHALPDAGSPDSAADASDSLSSVATLKRQSGNLISVYIDTRWSCISSSGLESEGHRAVVVNFDLLSRQPLERAKVSLHAQILQLCGSDATYYLTNRGFQCVRTFPSEPLKPPEEVGHLDYDNEQIQKAAGPDLSEWLKHPLAAPGPAPQLGIGAALMKTINGRL